MNPKDLLSDETLVKKRAFLANMGAKLKELSGLTEATSFEEFATRTVERGLTLLPVAYIGVAATSYATVNMMGDTQEITQMIGRAITITASSIAGLGTFLDIMGATVNKIRESEDLQENGIVQSFQINKSKVIGRMVAMSDNDPDPRAVNKNKLK